MSEVKRYDEYTCGVHECHGYGEYVKSSDFDRVTAERDALQARLTAADERADVLVGQLAESERKRREFVAAVKVETDQIEAKHSRCVVVPEGYAVVPIKPTKAMRDACQIAGKLPVWDAMMAAALKPAEPATDERTCNGCGAKGWTANCKECVPY